MTGIRWHEIRRERCAAAEAIRPRFSVHLAFDCIVGEKLLNFADAMLFAGGSSAGWKNRFGMPIRTLDRWRPLPSGCGTIEYELNRLSGLSEPVGRWTG